MLLQLHCHLPSRHFLIPKFPCVGLLLAFGFIASFVRSPLQRVAPGLIVHADSVELRPQSSGILAEFFVTYGQRVTKDQPIARLENSKLVDELDAKRIELQISHERAVHFQVQQKFADMQAEQSKLAALQRECDLLSKKVAALTIMAPQDGTFISSRLGRIYGDFVTESTVVGYIADPSKLQAEVSITQEDVERFCKQDCQ